MKRSWIGAGMLLALLITGLLVTWAMNTIHQPIAADLDAAGSAALIGDWDRALELSRRAEESWESCTVFRACFADHEPMEQIDSDFARLEIYSNARRQADFAAACRETARNVTAMGEAHKLLLHNFF